VRHEHRALPDLVGQGADVLLQPLPGQRVERGERLVHQQEPRAYELHGIALRRPAPRAASTAWDDMLGEVFALRVDATTARALTVMFDGLLHHALVSPTTVDRTDSEAPMRRPLGR